MSVLCFYFLFSVLYVFATATLIVFGFILTFRVLFLDYFGLVFSVILHEEECRVFCKTSTSA